MSIASPPNSNQPLCVGEAEAARLLDLSETTLFNLRRAGRIQSIKLGRGRRCRVLYPLSSLLHFIEENIQEAK